MNRRSILALFGGGAASAVSGVSVKEAAAQLGHPELLTVGSGDVAVATGISPPGSYAVISRLYRQRDREHTAATGLPPHIASKRSWSAVYKAAVYRREMEIYDALLEKMERDEAFTAQIARALGMDT